MFSDPDSRLINNRYRLRREIGRGSTGRVFAAWDQALEREVAVKVLDPQVEDDGEMLMRFEQEVRYTARLQHPGIVAVYESCQTANDSRCYIMSLARGESLETHLEKLKSAPDHWRQFALIERLSLFLKLVEVISYAHSKDIVHRDLKPANIIIGKYGEVWVLDWGLARSLREDTSQDGDDLEDAYDTLFTEGPRPGAATLLIAPGEAPTASTGPGAGAKGGTAGNPADPTTVPIDKVSPMGVTRRMAQSDSSTVIRRNQPATEPVPEVVPTGAKSGGKSSKVGVPSQTKLTSQNQMRSTQFGQVLGSPAYMSPEQAKGQAGAADKRTDIYSLGVILFELLTLHPPCDMTEGEEVMHFIRRVQTGQRSKLSDYWSDAPQALHVICEWALAVDPQDRYPECEVFAGELRTLLSQLSASFSEVERQRLAQEREGAWLPSGSWDFAATPGLGPFTLPSSAIRGDVVGQVMHPEMGGLLLGGNGLQIYPFTGPTAEDLRVRLAVEVVRGSEFWLFVRGVPPGPAYQFRIGAYNGKWMAIARGQGSDAEVLWPELLTMRPLRGSDTTFRQKKADKSQELLIEVIGSQLKLTLGKEPPLVFQDILVPSAGTSCQLAIATWKTQLVVRALAIERRRSPLMVPSHAVANELLRQGMHTLAIDAYRRFMIEHADTSEAAEAHFMLCLAYQRAGLNAAAEAEMRHFLSTHLEHPLAQDAIFELARLRAMSGTDGLERAVREVLSYQELGDYVRARFCLWLLPQLEDLARCEGLCPTLEHALELIKQLIRGSPDEKVILGTYAQAISTRLRFFISQLHDRGDDAQILEFRAAAQRCRAMGIKLSVRDPRTQGDYLVLARHLMTINDPSETLLYLGRGDDDAFALLEFVRDFFVLLALGCEEQLIAALTGDELTPIEHLVRSGLWVRCNRADLACADLEWCFRLTDMVEVERTSLVLLYAARMGCYGLGYLPWNLMVDGLDELEEALEGEPLIAIAGWLAETQGNLDDAAQIYGMLVKEGSGFATIARQGLARIGRDEGTPHAGHAILGANLT